MITATSQDAYSYGSYRPLGRLASAYVRKRTYHWIDEVFPNEKTRMDMDDSSDYHVNICSRGFTGAFSHAVLRAWGALDIRYNCRNRSEGFTTASDAILGTLAHLQICVIGVTALSSVKRLHRFTLAALPHCNVLPSDIRMSGNFQHHLAYFFQYFALCKAYFEAEGLEFVQGESFFCLSKTLDLKPNE